MTITRNFRGTSYRLAGDPEQNPVVVLIHGVGLNQSMWRAAVDLLARDFGVLVYDFLGHGDSHNPAGERRIRDYVEQLEQLMEHLGIDRFALAGFSMGGLIAQAFASLYPQRLTHLGLLHSVYQRTEAQCLNVRERYRATRDHGPTANLESAIERWFSAEYRDGHADVIDEIRAIFAAHSDDGYLKAYRLFAHAETEMHHYPLTGITCPALVITGSDDVGSTPAMSDSLCRALPNSRLIINHGHRHLAPLEHAGVVTGQLKSFLAATDLAATDLAATK